MSTDTNDVNGLLDKQTGQSELSPAEQSMPPTEGVVMRRGIPMSDKALAGLKTGPAARKAMAERRAAGEPTPLERYRAGEYPCSQWSDEEVSRGRPANIDGSFAGAWPALTARQSAEIKRELLKRGQQRLEQYYFSALETLNDVAEYGDSDAARVKAANILMERVAGKTPERIEIKSSDPWQDILDEVLNDEVLEPIERTEDSQAGG